MTMTLPLFILMMAAMMLPSAAPAIARRARVGAGVLAALITTAAKWVLVGRITAADIPRQTQLSVRYQF